MHKQNVQPKTKSNDPYLALLTYCAILLPWCNLSPAQLLTGRQLRATLPKWRSICNLSGLISNEFKRRYTSYKQQLMMTIIVYAPFLQLCKVLQAKLQHLFE